MEMTKSCEVNRSVYRIVSADPRQDSPLCSARWNPVKASEKMPVTNKHIELPAFRQFYFKGIVWSASEESRLNFNPLLPETLLDSSVEECVKIRLLMSKPEVSMITRHSVNSQPTIICQWDDEIVQEYVSTFVDLLKPNEFQFIGLFRVNRLAVYDVSEKEEVEVAWLIGFNDFVEFLGYR